MSIRTKKDAQRRQGKSLSPDRFKDPPQLNNQKPFNINIDKKLSVIDEIDLMKHRREERQRKKEEDKRAKLEMKNNPDYIAKLDTDYENLIRKKKAIIEKQQPEDHTTCDTSKIFVCVRKRPIFQKEILNGEIDCITAINPKLCVYDCKMKIDGFTKYIDCNEFYFDNVFNEYEDTNELYKCSIKPTIKLLLKGGVVTCFAYGQTGSGKTYTMKGIQDSAIDNMFEEFLKQSNQYDFYVSFFEIYSGRLYDLLNNRNKVMALEDKNQKVQIFGLEERVVTSPEEMKSVVDYANTMRTTHNTVTNETSSRSHAICNFVIKEKGKVDEEYAKLTLVDLAGSERATETQSNNKSRLAEGAEINKSLLALKECIRALDSRKTSGNAEQHVPFRTSKLTLVLRDSFIAKTNFSKIIMISCVSPGYSSANHTINTLRYSDRLKEKTSMMNKIAKQVNDVNMNVVIPSKDISKGNSNNNNNNGYSLAKKNNYVNVNNSKVVSLNDEIEDDMQQLIFNPTPISKPIEVQLNKANPSTNTNTDAITLPRNINTNNNNTISNKPKTDSIQIISPRKKQKNIKEPSSSAKPYSSNLKSNIDKQKDNASTNNNNNCKNITSSTNTNNSVNDIGKQPDWNYLREINEENKYHPNVNHNHNRSNEKLDAFLKEDNEENINDFFNEKANEPIPDLLEEQDTLILSHMNIIKNEAKLLTEEGTLISQIKGVTMDNYPMEDYAEKLEGIIQKKLNNYLELKKMIQNYKEMANTKVGAWHCK